MTITTTLPDVIHIGPFTYEVRIEPEPFVNDHQDGVLCGEANHNECLIRVLVRNPDQMYVTLWHEILHAIDEFVGTDLSEETVARLAPALVMALLQNGYVTREGGDDT